MEYQGMNIEFHNDPSKIETDSQFSRQAAHALLFCSCENLKLFGCRPMRYAVLMQLRHDGLLGFPGGFLDMGESIETGLNRELEEEINLNSKYFFTKNHYHGTWVHYLPSMTLIDHFYVQKVSEKDFSIIEKAALSSQEWGQETLGLLRVPLYDLRVLSNFFQHKFVGNARDQLVEILIKNEIYTADDINQAWILSRSENN